MHIAIKPHNAEFYKLLDVLWEEVEAKGFGSSSPPPEFSLPFTGTAHRLGGDRLRKPFSSNKCQPCGDNAPVDKAQLRTIMREAALTRARNGMLSSSSSSVKTASGGYRLGGESAKSGPKDPVTLRTLAADAAELRIAMDNVACGTEHPTAPYGERPDSTRAASSKEVNSRTASAIIEHATGSEPKKRARTVAEVIDLSGLDNSQSD